MGPPGRRGRGRDTEERPVLPGCGGGDRAGGYPSLSWLSPVLPVCAPRWESGRAQLLVTIHPPAHLPCVAVRGSGSSAMRRSQTPRELLFTTGRNLCCVLSKHMKSAEGSKKSSPGSWLWHPDLSKTSCADLGLARLNGDGDILLQRFCLQPFII